MTPTPTSTASPATSAPPASIPIPAVSSPTATHHGSGSTNGGAGHHAGGPHATPVTAPSTSSGAVTVGPLGIPSIGSTGGVSTAGGGTGTAHAGNITGALAPGTAAIGRTTAATRASRRHPHLTINVPIIPSLSGPLSFVVDHFIKVIPTGVWIALGALLLLALAAGAAALRSRRQVRIQAGEVAVVTAAALTDPLTGVFNRRGFLEAAERELDRARRYGHPLALAFVDIRGLKAVNDTEGHLAGDRLLKRVTALLRESARTHDLVGRIGGDELAVLLAEQSSEGAAAMTQRVRAQIPADRAALGLMTAWDVTIGTSTFPEDGSTLDELLATADRRLYQQRGIDLAR